MRGFFILVNNCIILIMRLLKQFLYGIFYLAVLGGILWLLYSITLKPAPSCFDNKQNGNEAGVDCGGNCVSCEIKNLSPLSLLPATLFSADRVFSASAELQNPNLNYGAKTFDYEVNFYDASDKVLETRKNKSFIYSGETKNLIEAGIRITNGIPARAEIKIDDKSIVWEKAENFSSPKYDLKNVMAELENGQAVIGGNITNSDNLTISKIIIGAFLIDKLGVKIGTSKTELQNIGPFRVENFKIFIPIRKDLLSSADLEATAQSVFVEILK